MREAKSRLQKVGVLKVANGEYIDKDGNKKTRWHEIGIVFATPHHTNMRIKLHANGFGDGQFANIYWDNDAKPNFADKEDRLQKFIKDLGIEPEEIPF